MRPIKHLYILIFTAICNLPNILWAQNTVIDSSSHIINKDFSIANYSSDNVLEQNSISALRIDRNGVLWFSTELDLNAFDGNNFVDYKTPEIVDYRIRGFYEVGDTFFLGGNLNYKILDGKLISEKLHHKGKYIFGSGNKLLSNQNYIGFNRLNDQLKENPLNLRASIYQVNDSSVYYVDKSLNVAVYYESGYEKERINLNGIRKTFKLNNYFIDYGTRDSLIFYDRGKRAMTLEKPYSNAKNEVYLYSDNMDKVYAYIENSLYHLELRKDTLIYNLIIKNLEIPCFSRILPFEGGFYIGSCNNGLYVLRWVKTMEKQLPITEPIYAHHEIGKDTILANNMLYHSNGIDSTPWPKGTFDARHILLDSKHKIWTRITSSIYEISPKNSWASKKVPFRGQRHLEDKDGKIWMFKKDTLRYRDGKTWHNVPIHIEAESRINLVSYDPFRHLFWIGFLKGAVIFNPEDKSITRVEALKGYSIRNVYPDSLGITWISTYGDGIFGYENGVTRSIPLDKLGFLKVSHCILDDGKGFFWISSNNGLFKVLKKEMNAAFNQEVNRVYYHRFDRSDGLKNNEFNGGCYPCGLKLSSGKISFSSLQGLTIFSPEYLKEEDHISKVFISKLETNEEEILLDSSYSFSQDLTRLKFFILSPYSGSFTNLYLEYRLKPQNTSWTPINRNNSIEFSKLNPGKYELEVRRKLGFGLNNYETASYSFYITPYFYQTLWFRILAIIFILMGILQFVLLRLKREEKKQLELENIIDQKTNDYKQLNDQLKLNLSQLRKAKDIQDNNVKLKNKIMGLYTHDIRGPLHFILSIIENSGDLKNVSQKDVQERLDIIKSSTKGIYMRTERIFNWMRTLEEGFEIRLYEIDLYNQVLALCSSFDDQAKQKQVELTNLVGEDTKVLGEKIIIDVILGNLLDNALKFTIANGHISIESYQEGDYTVVVVKDDGIGIAENQLRLLNENNQLFGSQGTGNETGKGYGLVSIKELLKKINGHMKMESKEDVGTSVSVYFKAASSSES
jgi:signal transduction histidine kinase